ncbi:MAG: M1 family metallopeptidase [Ignavibacteriales bacterium]|nr:M1 family metallopeptidase [Ignavibacteriales bacterium]
MLTPERTCYDVTYEHLKVRIDPSKKFISGSNSITFRATRDFNILQIDLFANMSVDSITFDRTQNLRFERELNTVFVPVPPVSEGSIHTIDFYYSGSPQEAQNPPWQGGFTWTTDNQENPWVVVTCQGTGASLWWPNKDHQSDEPDSMLISITVPPGLENVSNGKLRSKTIFSDGWTEFDWFVGYPINNYNVTINVGKFAHFSETFRGEEAEFPMDYYVLPENLQKARIQFQQVKPMMKCFEKFFGPYPFPRDGYKLVESPHTGMEHQSAVAYGNLYIQGYRGRASSPVGLKFDFIIIHETAHEWWGNSVTSEDIADMWIHESFGAYAEALYVEYLYGRNESLKYINGKKSNVRNAEPIIGTYNVHKRGSGDMYDKGQLVLNTLRGVIDNDSLWFAIIRGLATTYRGRIVRAEDIFNYINSKTGTDYTYFFEQYLKRTSIPVLQVQISQKGKDIIARYRWVADVAGFNMPVKVTTSRGKFKFIYPTAEWKSTTLSLRNPEEFSVAEDLYYIDVRKSITYLDPQTPEQPARRQ